jgi:hypothetical protein
MGEHVGAVKRFADDLYAVGIVGPQLAKAAFLYFNALSEGSEEVWTRVYRHVSELLQQESGEPTEPFAVQRLFAFVDDDFGRSVLELPVRVRLHELLLQNRVA